jgi:hypothetical protein
VLPLHGGDRVLLAKVVGKQSTRKGRCKRGHTARLALLLVAGAWPRQAALRFALPTGEASIAQFEVSIG